MRCRRQGASSTASSAAREKRRAACCFYRPRVGKRTTASSPAWRRFPLARSPSARHRRTLFALSWMPKLKDFATHNDARQIPDNLLMRSPFYSVREQHPDNPDAADAKGYQERLGGRVAQLRPPVQPRDEVGHGDVDHARGHEAEERGFPVREKRQQVIAADAADERRER